MARYWITRGGMVLTALLVASICARGAGVDVKAGEQRIHAEALTQTIFRISITTDGAAPHAPKSMFIDPALAASTDGTISRSGKWQTIKTAAGELRIGDDGSYALRDARRTELIPRTPLADAITDDPAPALAVKCGWSSKEFMVYGCGNGSPSLRQTQVLAHVGNGVAVEPFFWAPRGFGMLVLGDNDNAPAQCDGKITQGAVTWKVRGHAADIYLIIAPTLGDGVRGLLKITGTPPVPPRWTLGYLQSRWGWKDKAYIDDTLKEFLNRKLPVDGFIFDFEWYTPLPDYQVKVDGVERFSDFGFNPALFPQPADEIQTLHAAGLHFVGIRKPRLGNRETLAMIRAKGWGFTSTSKVDGRGLAFSNPAARTWYAKQIEPLLKAGVDGWWDDEGEFSYTNYIYWNMAQRQALDAVRPNERLWTIDRSFSPGLSRLGAAAWTGDIDASWKALQQTPTDLLNWSAAGMPFCGCDIGGFLGQTTPELLTRWMEAGVFFPVMRSHSTWNVQPHFPWLYGSDAEGAMRQALDLRYQLIPMLYSLAHETHDTGAPIMRPLLMDFPSDAKVSDMSDEWLIGHGILAAPILNAGGKRSVYLPGGTWYDFFSGEKFSGKTTIDVTRGLAGIPVYVRAGTIVPLGPVIEHTSEMPGGPLEVRIYPGKDSLFTLVEDDGVSEDYLKGAVRKTLFAWDDKAKALSWKRSGSYAGKDCFTSMRVHVTGDGGKVGNEIALTAEGRWEAR